MKELVSTMNLKEYMVEDVLGKDIEYIFILESPLQSSAYHCDVINSETCKIFRMLEQIRKNPSRREKKHKDYDKDEINSLIQKISDAFKARIEKIDNYQNKKYILCGAFVQEVLKDLQMNLTDTLDVPHPSFNNWKKEKYKDEINKLKNYLDLFEKDK